MTYNHDDAEAVRDAVRKLRDRVSEVIGDDTLLPVIGLVRNEDDLGPIRSLSMSERKWRILRFALNRALEDM